MENSKVEKAKPRLMLRSKSVLIPMITFGALLICYGAYVFWYVSGQENYYNDRAFRVLSVLNQRFHDSVEVRIRDVLGAATENPRRKDLGVGNAGSTGPVGSLEGFVADTLEPYGVTLENIKTDWEGTCKKAHRDGEISLIEGGSAGPFSLTAEYSFQVSSDQGCSGAGKISAPLQPDAVIRPQFEDLEEGFFDDVFIADESGRVLYQQSTGGDRVAWLNELVRYKPDGTALIPLTADFSSAKGTTPFAAASGSSTIRDVDIAGASYKLYLQPSTVMIHKDSLPRTLVLCGLRSTKRFNADKLSLPGADVILGVLTLLSILALGWPFLMMACVSPKQRMSRVQFLLLVVSFLVAGATLAADALNVTYFLAENAESRDHLQLLAIQINDQVKSELRRALNELDDLSRAQPLETLHREENEKRNGKEKVWYGEPYYFKQDKKEEYWKSYTASPGGRYPWFLFAFWTDKDGLQQMKIAAGSMTPQVDISKKEYFKPIASCIGREDACADALPELDRLPNATEGSQPSSPFLVQPSISPNTGEISAIISSVYKNGDPKQKEWGLQTKYLAINFESLVNPVLPQDYGFAVINAAGKVQFHSVSHRNLIEDFPRETQPDSEFRARLAQGSSGFLTTRYLGKQQMLYMTPLDVFRKPPLTLVVFRSYEHFSDSIKEANTLLVFLILGYIAALCLAATVYFVRHREYPLADLWPNAARRGIYVNMALTNLFLASAFLLRYRTMTSFGALFAAFGLGAVAMIYPFGETASEGRGRRIATRALVLAYLTVLAGWSWQLLFAAVYAAYLAKFWNRLSYLPAVMEPRERPLRYIYAVVVASLLFTVMMVPCCGLFKFAHDVIELREAQEDQVELARKLDQRGERIHKYLLRIQATELEPLRLQETLDRYDRSFFNQFPPGMTPPPEGRLREGSMFRLWLADSCAALFSPIWCDRQILSGNPNREEFHWQIIRKNEDAGAAVPAAILPALVLRKTVRGAPDPIVSEFPSWPGFDGWGSVSFLAAGLLLAFWIYYATCQLFFMKWTRQRDLDVMDAADLEAILESGVIYKHILIIGHPKSGKGSTTRSSLIGYPIDIAVLAATEKWDVDVPQDKKIVILDHFDFGMDTAAVNMKKLALLENLIYVEHRSVVILSTVDLMFYLVSGSPEIVSTHPRDSQSAVQILDRWAGLLCLFLKARLKDKSIAEFDTQLGKAQEQHKDPNDSPSAQVVIDLVRRERNRAARVLIDLVRTECNHTAMLRRVGSSLLPSHLRGLDSDSKAEDLRESVVKDVLDRADAYYRALWATCTKDERLVLFQLSKDGWVNPKNEHAIQELERRGLVVWFHGFRIMNESFRRFIEANQHPEDIAAWEEDVRHSVWSGLQTALIGAGVLVGAWLLFTQQQTVHLALGYVGAIGGAAATVGTLLSTLRGHSPKNAPPGAESA